MSGIFLLCFLSSDGFCLPIRQRLPVSNFNLVEVYKVLYRCRFMEVLFIQWAAEFNLAISLLWPDNYLQDGKISLLLQTSCIGNYCNNNKLTNDNNDQWWYNWGRCCSYYTQRDINKILSNVLFKIVFVLVVAK